MIDTERETADLDSSLKLLEEYTVRTRSLYMSLEAEKRKRLTFLYLVVATIAFTGFILLTFSRNLIEKSDEVFSLYLGVFAILSLTVSSLFVIRKGNSTSNQKNLLIISVKQLKKLIVLISQYTQHNSTVLTELKRFELDLRLIEAEEVANIAKKIVDIDTNNYEKKEVINLTNAHWPNI